MSFALFLLYLFIVIVRPIEALELDVGNARPMLVLWLFAFVFGLVRAVTKGEIAARPAHVFLFGMLLVAIMASQIRQGYLGGALQGFLDFGTSAGLFFLVALNVTTMPRLKAACGVLLAGVVVVAGAAVYSYHTGFMSDLLVLMQGIDFDGAEAGFRPGEITAPAADTSGLVLWRIRGLGFMNDPNDLAQAIVMVLPLLWGLHRAGKRIGNLLFVYLPGALLGYAIYLTHSRGAVIGVVSLFLFALHKWLGTVKTVMAAALIMLLPIVVNMGGGRGFSSSEQSAGGRIEAWYEGIQMLKHNPVFGVGYGNFLDHHFLTAHNSFVLAFAELGLFGYFAWIGILVITYLGLKRVIDRASPDSDEYRLAILIRASLIGFLTCAWFLSRTYQATLFLTVGFGAAVWYLWQKGEAAGEAAGEATGDATLDATRDLTGGQSKAPARGAGLPRLPIPGMAKVGPHSVPDVQAPVTIRRDAPGPSGHGPSRLERNLDATGRFELRDGRRRYVPLSLRKALHLDLLDATDPAGATHPAWLRPTVITIVLSIFAVYLFVLLDNLLVK